MEKEKNFISAVAYIHNDAGRVKPFLQRLYAQFDAAFATYEIILVNDACSDASVQEAKEFVREAGIKAPITIVNMSIYQGVELAMNAGLDLAIGDFVYEFDTLMLSYEEELICKAYYTVLEGHDIVSVCPRRARNLGSNLFYRLFNSASKSKYKLQTDIFRVLSRRAINRVHAITATMPYRKAAYAASGLAVGMLYTNQKQGKRKGPRMALAVNSLALYTDAAYKLSLGISGALLLATLVELVYTVVINFSGRPIEGWTTTMLVLSFGFFGVFLVLAIVVKYLSLVVELLFKQQKYLIEGVEKL
ncbi:MAG: glycosyltransferase [Oscillospiraceae bacterium]|nr:glycosyltransferase [Oscillospiraceae bacterium]